MAAVMEQAISRTKIVATVGPASRPPEMLSRLIEAGVNVFRLNFSHGTHEEHTATLQDIRSAARAAGAHVAVLQDLSGPKMRLGPIPGDAVECVLGAEFRLVADRTSDSPRELTCTYRDLANDLKVGETVLFADGTVAMAVTETQPGLARLQVTLPGRLRSRQGINLPGSTVSVSSLTEKDLLDLDWSAGHTGEVDYVGLSFVRSPNDLERLRRELNARRSPARIVAKIEKPQAVQNLEAIVAAADAVMVARGDLGVELDVAQVPGVQKRIIALCNQAHRPVITATQMLGSMEHSDRPTRAEASDVFNAVLDGTDAVMLSGETAIGEYPIESVRTMRRICTEAERAARTTTHTRVPLFAGGVPQLASKQWHTHATPPSLAGLVQPITEAMVDAACLAADRLQAAVLVVTTESGRTARALSNRRPGVPVLALTRTPQTARSLALCWGVTPLVLAEVDAQADSAQSVDEEFIFAIHWAMSQRLLKAGQYVVLLRGKFTGPFQNRAVLARKVE